MTFSNTVIKYRKLINQLADLLVILTLFIIGRLILGSQFLEVPFQINLISLVIVLFLYVIFFSIFHLYSDMWRYASSSECLKCILVSLSAGFSFCLIDSIIIGRNIFLYDLIYTVVLSLTLVIYRLMYAEYRNWEVRKANSLLVDNLQVQKKLLIVGAGFAATTLLNEMKHNSNNQFIPVCAVDDDITKLNKFVLDVKVNGTIEDIPRLVKEKSIDEIFICIPSATAEERTRIIEYCASTRCPVKILPDIITTLTNPQNLERKMKPIEIHDILGRDEISFEKGKIEKFVYNKVVLVTGGGGSIGSELCRQIAIFEPKDLIILDINENNAYNIQQELIRNFGGRLSLHVEIASIRDLKKIEYVVEYYRPDLIFHAAAHKHVPMMEHNPEEAIKNNIFGTNNVMAAALKYGVSKFILISSDKAVNPTNIMGATKRFTEMIVQSMIGTGTTEFVAVRFGNVLGSAGSVVPLFKKQIEAGGPVTVTHKDMKRYFMSIPEAVQLLLVAAHMAKSGQVYVLDMGKPVKILDLAVKMIKLMGYVPYGEIPIRFTGLRPGEKLYEELLMDEEGVDSTSHERIFIGHQEVISRKSIELKLVQLNNALLMKNKNYIFNLMQKIVPTYIPTDIVNDGKRFKVVLTKDAIENVTHSANEVQIVN